MNAWSKKIWYTRLLSSDTGTTTEVKNTLGHYNIQRVVAGEHSVLGTVSTHTGMGEHCTSTGEPKNNNVKSTVNTEGSDGTRKYTELRFIAVGYRD